MNQNYYRTNTKIHKNFSFKKAASVLFFITALLNSQVHQIQAGLGLLGDIDNPLPNYPDGLPQATIFLSYLIRLITAVAGIYAFINFLVAGFGFISSAGNPEGVSKAWQKIYQSIIGLSVVILSFAFAGLMGWILYGNPAAFLHPTIYGPDVIP